MEKETLYKFFDGKASREEKEAVRIWLKSSPENNDSVGQHKIGRGGKEIPSFLPDCFVRSHKDCRRVCYYRRLRNVFL